MGRGDAVDPITIIGKHTLTIMHGITNRRGGDMPMFIAVGTTVTGAPSRPDGITGTMGTGINPRLAGNPADTTTSNQDPQWQREMLPTSQVGEHLFFCWLPITLAGVAWDSAPVGPFLKFPEILLKTFQGCRR
jgi:hypothetical protein